ncbi:MAG TPA: DEAD/DEAH box helicase [Bryobacteraceae bacterium]|jgi:ATP-dependent Lhr-like helicase|nr:DEAD/DEAH box helicase [Bryobacteraceae bacterium]
MPLSRFDPLVAEWFSSRFGAPTEPQIAGWEKIASGDDVLISAPTGSGKTLAAFLICIDRLVRAARANSLPDGTQVVYVSPLKALSNDVRRNLETPLQEIAALARLRGVELSPIRTAVRTGDTPAAERQRMSKHPPHILVTTPESLYILLTAEKSRRQLAGVQTIVVDEIHAVADDKRGSHLALTLARFDAVTETAPQRIGLSATVKPIDEVARFLTPPPRPPAAIVDIGHRREMGLSIEVPNDELGAIATSEMWDEIYDRLAAHIIQERTTLIFVNTRRLSERVAHALGERLGHNVVLPHHGSLARALRHDAELRLKNGELKAVVATASLELGIDIGAVDLVIQVGSPRAIAVALQRVGRSGHWVGARPRGIFFATTRDELIECAAVIRAIHAGELERLEIPRNALDILSQQIVAEAACQPWQEDDLFNLVRSAYPYRDLPRKDFDAVIEMLSEGIATSRGRSGAMLHRDQVNHRVRGRRGARLAAITSGGAIPDSAQYAVIAEPEGKSVGSLDEDFAVESLTGDVFLLGTHSWRIRHVGQGKVRVEDAHGAKPSLPFWLGEAPGRSVELSASVSEIRDRIAGSSDDEAKAFLIGDCGLDQPGAVQAIAYLRAGLQSLGAMPSIHTVVAERFFDESGGMQLILHAPFGARINRAWGLALRKRFCRTFNFELQAAATDNGIVISLNEQHAFPLETVFEFLQPESAEYVLTQALLDSPMFAARWRWNASRALAIPRFLGGKKVPAPILRMRAEDLLGAVFPDQIACAENLSGPIRIPDHPLVNETISNCLHEAMDLNRLRELLEAMESGAVRTIAVENATPSVFSHEILGANAYAFLDDAPLEERRARAVQLGRSTGGNTKDGAGILDQAAIEQVAAEVWPEPRDADELHDAMLTFISAPAIEEWQPWFVELYNTGRAGRLRRNDTDFWVATERRASVADTQATVRGWLEYLGPVTAAELAARLALPKPDIEIALAALESEGQIFQGRYRTPSGPEVDWCNRRILARIHRLTMGRLRSEIAPVTAAQFHQFLLRWQHATPGTQLHGPDGVLQVVRQLQGFEVPAAAWEPEIFSRRIAAYEPENLDDLCLSGEVAWARLSPHPALNILEKRVRPTRIAPISFFVREDAEWLALPPGMPGLSHAGREVHEALTKNGASFFVDLVRATRRLPSEVEDALWELTAGGLVTADGFENLRALIDPKRRRGEGRSSARRPRHAAGRWALVNYAALEISVEERLRRHAKQLLLRWGVLFRDLLARETVCPPWRELLPVLRRMEAQGEIRGGRFVSGFTGEQFARPEAIDLLRAVRRGETIDSAADISAADPLNLTGIVLPGPRVSSLTRTPMPPVPAPPGEMIEASH